MFTRAKLSFCERLLTKEVPVKIKILAVFMLSAVLSVAQTLTQTKPVPPDTPSASSVAQDTKKAGCPCCQKMAEGKDAKSCCPHDAATTGEKEATSCCQGKDGTSCMKGDKDKSADAACGNGKCCGGNTEEGCCAKADKTTEQVTMACCGGPDGHCAMAHHAHRDLNK